jgi:hypothetical protein
LNPWRWVRTFFGSSTRSAPALAVVFAATLPATTVFGADFAAGFAVLEPALEADAVFDEAVFEPAVFEATVLAGILAVLLGISPLLFLEGFPAEPLAAVRVFVAAVRARTRAAPRRAADALDVVFFRVFCDTVCAWTCHALLDVFTGALLGSQAAKT